MDKTELASFTAPGEATLPGGAASASFLDGERWPSGWRRATAGGSLPSEECSQTVPQNLTAS